MIQGARIDTLSRTDIIFNKYSEGVACGKQFHISGNSKEFKGISFLNGTGIRLEKGPANFQFK